MLRLLALTCWLLLTRGAEAAAVEFRLSDAKGQPIADAVVSLVALDPIDQSGGLLTPVEIVQRGQEFIPFVTAIAAGTTVVFPNSDNVQHHIYSLSKPKKFELPLYRPGQHESVTFNQPGIVALGCNIHDWMSAYVVVLDTPWFAKSSASGHASIPDVANGNYRVEVWHYRLAKTEARELRVTDSTAAAEPVSFTLTLKTDRRIRRTPDAAGAGYK